MWLPQPPQALHHVCTRDGLAQRAVRVLAVSAVSAVAVVPNLSVVQLQVSADPRALEEPTMKNDPDSAALGDVIEDTSIGDINEAMVYTSMVQDLNAVLQTLTRREHGILRMRYGLDDGQPKTLEEIGAAFRVRHPGHGINVEPHVVLRRSFGLIINRPMAYTLLRPRTPSLSLLLVQVTRERIRQIENKALAKLKDPPRHCTLKTYMNGEALNSCVDPGWKGAINRGGH